MFLFQRAICVVSATTFLLMTSGMTRAQEVQTPTSENGGDADAGGGGGVPRWRLPVHVSVSANTGYDENASTTNDQQGSFFTGVNIGLSYQFGTSRTHASLTTGTGFTYYPDLDNNRYDPDLSLTLTVSHEVNLRLSVNAVVSASYQSEPDFGTTLSIDRRAGNYFTSQDSISASYQWLPRFTTVTGYSFSTVQYDDAATAFIQNQVDNSFNESLRFLVLPVTTFVAEYSVSFTSYQGGDRDSHVQTVTVGFDHTVSERLQGGIHLGAEFRTTDNPIFQANDGIGPHADAILTYVLGGKTSLSWTASYGTQQSYVADSAASVTFHTGLQASYAITPRLTSTISGYYDHNENKGPETFPGSSISFTENSIDVSLGLSYTLNRYWAATATYSHTDVDSDLGIRSYSRNRYSGGITLNF